MIMKSQSYFDLLVKYSTLILFIVVIGTFSILSDSFFSFQNFFNVLIQASALGIVAVGMTFILLTAGIDLSVGSIMFLAGVMGAKLMESGFNIWLGCSVFLVVGILFGAINGIFVAKAKIIPFIVTLATYYMGRGYGLYISETRAIYLPEAFLEIGASNFLGIPIPIMIFGMILLIAHLLLSKTSFGKKVYALGHNQEKARKAGINVPKVLFIVYVIGGLMAAIGGLVAIAQLGSIAPAFGQQREFLAIAAAVLGGTSLFGGRGTVFPGTLIGVLLMQSLENGLVMINANPYIYPLITGVVIFLIVLLDSMRNRQFKKRVAKAI